jgi:hypothetical protein
LLLLLPATAHATLCLATLLLLLLLLVPAASYSTYRPSFPLLLLLLEQLL